MSGRKMKVESIPAWGNYHCSSMCQACTVCGWGGYYGAGCVCVGGGGTRQSVALTGRTSRGTGRQTLPLQSAGFILALAALTRTDVSSQLRLRTPETLRRNIRRAFPSELHPPGRARTQVCQHTGGRVFIKTARLDLLSVPLSRSKQKCAASRLKVGSFCAGKH